MHGRLSLLANKKAAHQKQLGSELTGLLSASKFDSARIRVRLVELVAGWTWLRRAELKTDNAPNRTG